MTSSPSDEDLQQAVTELRKLHPNLARAKLLSLLKETHSWSLSEERLKKCLDTHNLNIQPSLLSDDLPRDAKFQAIVKEAFQDFKIRERNFLLSLSKSQMLKATIGERADPIYAACHLRHYIEILLVLKEFKPCALVAHYTVQEIFTEMVQQCLEPVMKQYKLARYGFQLQQITHPVPTTVHRGFQNAWVFADTRSSLWPDVEEVFLTPNKGPVDEKRVGVVLGYPVHHGGRDFRAVDYTEMDDLRITTGKDVCCVSAYEFTCLPGTEHFKELILHFQRCFEAAEEVGTHIRMDVNGHKELNEWIKRVKSESQG
ncbi:hypothetical protein N431DRAFT_97124 [Stipitochalara longipes BDJ]|nr:hypothetical protein N431DRAFT_97124 [Stipitochalara longipes BDJ]